MFIDKTKRKNKLETGRRRQQAYFMLLLLFSFAFDLCAIFTDPQQRNVN